MSGFQTQVYNNPAPAVEGDFASANPRTVVLAGPGGLIAGSLGAVVGRFCWLTYQYADFDDAPAVVNSFGTGPVAGILHREQQGLIQNYLQEFSMVVPGGFPVTLFDNGDFWIKNRGTTYAQAGMKAYANFADGGASFAATGSPGTASGSASSIAANTLSITGGIVDNVMTVTAVGSGTVVPGATLSGTNVVAGTQVVSQLLPLLSGEAVGGVGRYTVSIPGQSVASTTISGTYGTLTVGGTIAGAFGVGNTLSGSGVVAGTTITALGTGTGGAGTYIVNNNTVVASTAITANLNVETKWVARSAGNPGELIKVSSWLQG